MLENLIDEFMSEKEVNFFTETYLSTLSYGDKSNGDIDPHGHWSVKPFRTTRKMQNSMSYDITRFSAFQRNYPEFCTIWNRLKEYLPDGGKERGVSRVYFNGYTFGTDGYIHRDDPWVKDKYFEKSETCMIYLNKKWDYNWGGETVIINDDTKDIVHSVLPKLGRLIVFGSHDLHGARPLSRMCNDLRLIMVYKAFNTNLNHPGIEYLLNNGFDAHGGDNKSIFENLYGMVNHASKFYNCDSGVMNCILFHSVYNVPFVKPNRNEIGDCIGDQSEEVVFEYSKFNYDTKKILESPDVPMRKYHLMIELVRLECTEPQSEYIAKIKYITETKE